MRDLNFKNPRNERNSFFKEYRKGFHEFKVASSFTTPKFGEVMVWNVISSGKRSTLFRFLFLKWLWDELTSKEFGFIISLPEFFSTEEFVACARAYASGSPKKIIRTRLNEYRKLRGFKTLSQEKYRSMKSGLKYSLQEYNFRPGPTKKYSGWTRHHRDHGSLGKFHLEPIPTEFTEKLEIDLFMILTVGRVEMLGSVLGLSPDEDSKESKRTKKYV
jgi:hypothetical protein